MVRRSLTDLAMLGRLTRDLPAFLRTPLTVDQAAVIVRRRLKSRSERFLRMAARTIYGYPRSPYLKLLRWAGCELGDLGALVRQEGVEVALSRLAAARKWAIESDGAHLIARYSTVEAGQIGFGCEDPRAPDDVHIFSDRFALIQHARPVTDIDVSVDALLFTSLVPSAPEIFLNAETGDLGIVERRSCGCKRGALGLRDHLSQIRTFEKLTGEGMTFVKTNLLPILEEMLPARFGGASADYQLVEEEGEDGILQLLLLVDPCVGPVDQFALKRAFLDELGRGSQIEGYMAAMWRRAETVQVQRRPPVATRGGKILPFHLVN